MVKLPKPILAEREYVEKALSNLSDAMAREEKSVVELASIGTFLHNIYNGIENILKRVLADKSIALPQTATWHKDLLILSVSTGIISEKLSDKLYEYLTFRHFFIHAYGFMLEESEVADLAANIQGVWNQFLQEIENHYR